MLSEGLTQYKLSYQISPIALTGGIATDLPGGVMPIIYLLQPEDYSRGILSGGDPEADLNKFFAHFEPAAGSTLTDNDIGNYPFANQAIAANAIIFNPLKVSLIMHTPVQLAGGYQDRSAKISNLQAQFAKHNSLGGLYNIATPSFWWVNCILLRWTDISAEGPSQIQTRWQLDFINPLVSLGEAQALQNSLMQKITNGSKMSGNPPPNYGLQSSVGNPSSLQSPAVIPAATPLPATSPASAPTNGN